MIFSNILKNGIWKNKFQTVMYMLTYKEQIIKFN